MGLRNKWAERGWPYLESDEQIQSAFIAMSGPSPYWALLTGPLIQLLFSQYHQVVVTDRAIVVFDTTKWFAIRPARLRLRHPRSFYFGRMRGRYGSFWLGDTKYWVHWPFHKDVAAADAALAMSSRGR